MYRMFNQSSIASACSVLLRSDCVELLTYIVCSIKRPSRYDRHLHIFSPDRSGGKILANSSPLLWLRDCTCNFHNCLANSLSTFDYSYKYTASLIAASRKLHYAVTYHAISHLIAFHLHTKTVQKFPDLPFRMLVTRHRPCDVIHPVLQRVWIRDYAPASYNIHVSMN